MNIRENELSTPKVELMVRKFIGVFEMARLSSPKAWLRVWCVHLRLRMSSPEWSESSADGREAEPTIPIRIRPTPNTVARVIMVQNHDLQVCGDVNLDAPSVIALMTRSLGGKQSNQKLTDHAKGQIDHSSQKADPTIGKAYPTMPKADLDDYANQRNWPTPNFAHPWGSVVMLIEQSSHNTLDSQ